MRTSLSLLIALTLGAAAWAGDQPNDLCRRALSDSELALSYDPEAALARSGFAPNAIRLSTDLPEPGETFGGQEFRVLAHLRDSVAGELIGTRIRKHPGLFKVVFSKIPEPNLRQRGLGTLMYLSYAKVLWERHQLRLTADFEQSGDAVGLWASFARKGWTATDPETGRVYLRPDALDAPSLRKLESYLR